MVPRGGVSLPWLWIVLVAILTPALLVVVEASSSNVQTTQTTTFESVRDLDASGTSVQLRNAQAAADQQGRLVVAIVQDRSIHVYTFHNTLASAARRTQPARVQALTANVYCACTGVQADADYLIRHLQLYIKTAVERYQTTPSLFATATAAATLYRQFWGYDDRQAWQGMAQSILNQQDDDDEIQWSRPLGVRSMLLQAAACNKPMILLMEPSGLMQPCPRIACMGPLCNQVQRRLEETLNDSKDNSNSLDEQVLEAVSAELGAMPARVSVEIVRPDRLDRRTMQPAQQEPNRKA